MIDYLVERKFNIHDLKVNTTIQEIFDEIQRMENKTMADVMNIIFSKIGDMYINLSSPTLDIKKVEKGYPPLSTEYNTMLNQIRNDLIVGYDGILKFGLLATDFYNYHISDITKIIDTVKSLNNVNNTYTNVYDKVNGNNHIVVSESFSDNSKIDLVTSDPKNILHIDNRGGILTLKRISNEVVTQNATIDDLVILSPQNLQRGVVLYDKIIGPGPTDVFNDGFYEGLFYGPKGGIRLEPFFQGFTPDIDKISEYRKKVFDNNPDTFWEIEYVVDRTPLRSEAFNIDSYGTVQNLVFDDSKIEDTIDFTVQFVVTLEKPTNINWIQLNPHNFGHTNYMDIIDVETSTDKVNFQSVLSSRDKDYDITLTGELNEVLTPSKQEVTLSNDKFGYAGQGIWTFSTRLSKFIRFTIRQRQNYPLHYSTTGLVTLQVKTVTNVESRWWGNDTSTTNTYYIYTIRELNYLQDVTQAEMGLAATTGTQSSSTGGYANSTWDIQVSGETVVKTFLIDKYDKLRYSIGIRDLNIYSYVFDSTGEINSIDFFSPKPVKMVELEVDEKIPEEFLEGSLIINKNNYIKYYVSIDGNKWNRISPKNHSQIQIDDLPPSQTLYINSDITPENRVNPDAYIDSENDIHDVKLKIEMMRPDGELYQALSPILYGYNLKIYT